MFSKKSFILLMIAVSAITAIRIHKKKDQDVCGLPKRFEKLVKDIKKSKYEEKEERFYERLIEYLNEEEDYVRFVNLLRKVAKNDHLLNLLRLGYGEGRFARSQTSQSKIQIPVLQLSPMQSEIMLENSVAYPFKKEGYDCSGYFVSGPVNYGPNAIITANNKTVVDGHHRWSQVFLMNPYATIEVLNLEFTKKVNSFTPLRDIQGAIAVETDGNIPSSTAKNAFNVFADKSEEEVIAAIKSTILDKPNTDKCVSEVYDGIEKVVQGEDKEWFEKEKAENEGEDGKAQIAVDWIFRNIQLIRKYNQPINNAPDRDYMPQTSQKSLEIFDGSATLIQKKGKLSNAQRKRF